MRPEILGAPEVWPVPQGLRSLDSQGEANSIIKVKEKPELNFCVQTDDDISLWPGIINESEKSK